jgi:hypothetical protein
MIAFDCVGAGFKPARAAIGVGEWRAGPGSMR